MAHQTRLSRGFSFAAIAVFALSIAGRNVLADGKTYQDALRSTVWILSKVSGQTSSGTGVLVDAQRKLIVTTFHVVGEARSAIVFFPDFENGKPVVDRDHYVDAVQKLGIRGRVVAVDRKRDLALIELDRLPESVQPIKMAAAGAGPGDAVESIGNPGSSDALWVYTSGTVRSVYKKQFRTSVGEHDFTVVETQSPINTGDSGGPVLNPQGELVAISQAISPSARIVSYAVDLSEVRDFMNGPWKPAALPISDVLAAAGLEFTPHTSGHLELQIGEGKQKATVFVAKDLEYFEKAEVRKIWALAGVVKQAPRPDTLMKLLEQNGKTKLGSWSIERTEAGDFLMIYCAKLDATASPEAVRSTIEYVAKLSTLMHKELDLPDEKAQVASDNLGSWLK